MKFPLFIYIKPPDDTILQHIVPTVWWESQHVKDSAADNVNKRAYYDSCDTLQRHVSDLEDLQVSLMIHWWLLHAESKYADRCYLIDWFIGHKHGNGHAAKSLLT